MHPLPSDTDNCIETMQAPAIDPEVQDEERERKEKKNEIIDVTRQNNCTDFCSEE